MQASPLSKEARSKALAGAITATRAPGARPGGAWNTRVVVMCYTAPDSRLWREARRSSNDRLSAVAAAARRLLAAGAPRPGAVPDRVAAAPALQAGGSG